MLDFHSFIIETFSYKLAYEDLLLIHQMLLLDFKLLTFSSFLFDQFRHFLNLICVFFDIAFNWLDRMKQLFSLKSRIINFLVMTVKVFLKMLFAIEISSYQSISFNSGFTNVFCLLFKLLLHIVDITNLTWECFDFTNFLL